VELPAVTGGAQALRAAIGVAAVLWALGIGNSKLSVRNCMILEEVVCRSDSSDGVTQELAMYK